MKRRKERKKARDRSRLGATGSREYLLLLEPLDVNTDAAEIISSADEKRLEMPEEALERADRFVQRVAMERRSSLAA